MTTSVNSRDPRVKRTRQLLLQAFITLVEERHNLHSISVQEVAKLATVNRATFYDHFEDKYALLQCWMHQKFHQKLTSQFPASSTLQLSTLHQLIRSVFDVLALFRSYVKPADRQYEPLFESVLQQELYALLLRWLKQVPTEAPLQEEAGETTAQVISWAILGPATQWSRGDQTVAAEEMTRRVLRVVIAGMSPLTTVT
ncbi:TetR/AcrR family transcriptional regulator [Ktedonosporobacter rubrisoli]|uniref:TetR/AcrR family transcriptional regulator n=1 Tax=Ktedonosporobacter rubrisoli TaxID=2509675 RepID=UPI0013EE8C39|nr:TetR/AcrR family transcriptional regulator [Ktedonosporobacter rubrisoli]